MSYDNAEPKILKTLDSSGQVLDDSGNVISETSDYWVRTYNQAEPKPDKILKSDGTIVDSEGNLIQDTTPFNVKKYNQAEPIPVKYLHADGTIDENSGSGGGADLEDDHQTTIDVSTYTEPVEVEPTAGKDGMKKNTITLENIPSGGGTFGYAWECSDAFAPLGDKIYTSFDIPPVSFSGKSYFYFEFDLLGGGSNFNSNYFNTSTYAISPNLDSFGISERNVEEAPVYTYRRVPADDITDVEIWNTLES